jgi:mRNA-degrading endonuclease RelE of RelBE toxin-antitoxin system
MELPVHAWEDWGCYHGHIMKRYDEERRWTGENKVKLARSLWRLYLPDIRLEEIGIDEFVKLLKHPAVKSLQRFIQKSRFNPEDIDHKFYIETQREVSEMYKRAGRYRVIFGIGWTAVSTLASTVWPPAGLSGIAFEIAMQRAISTILHILEKKKFPWKVALEDIGVFLKKSDVDELQKEVGRKNHLISGKKTKNTKGAGKNG